MLFDLQSDRGETQDLISSHPDIARELMASYEAYAERAGVVLATPPLPRGPEP